MSKFYDVYSGKFNCKECKQLVTSMRLWKETGVASWRCKDGHVSEVQVIPTKNKKKKDYDRKE